MKSPALPPLPMPSPALGKPALSLGQILPARVITPAEAQQLALNARDAVLETSIGLVRLRTQEPASQEPVSRPANPERAVTPQVPGLVPDTVLRLKIVALAPQLRLQVLPALTRRDGSGATATPPSPPLPVSARLSNAEFIAELLPPSLARAFLSAQRTALIPRAAVVAQAMAHTPPLTAPRLAPEMDVSPPRQTQTPSEPERLRQALQEPLRTLYPRQQPVRDVLPQLLKLLPKLPPLQARTGKHTDTAPVMRLLTQLVRAAVRGLPTPVQLRQPDVLRALLAAELRPVPLPTEAPSAKAMSTARSAPASRPAVTLALDVAEPSSSDDTPQPPVITPRQSRPSPELIEGEAPQASVTTTRLVPAPWPRLAEALRVLVEAARAPQDEYEPLAMPAPPQTPAPTPGANPPLPGTSLLARLEKLVHTLFPDQAALFNAEDVLPAGGREPVVVPGRLPAPILTVLDRELLDRTLGLVDTLSARSQFLHLQSAQSQSQGQSIWQFELPVRDGRQLDVLDLQIEERRDETSAEDGPKRHYWSVTLQFDFPNLGPIRSVVHWQRELITTRFFAERPETIALVNGELDWLSTALAALGLRSDVHGCEQADLAPRTASTHEGLVDVSA